jgi:hypothetical protein
MGDGKKERKGGKKKKNVLATLVCLWRFGLWS